MNPMNQDFFKDIYNLILKKNPEVKEKEALYMTQRWLSFYSDKYATVINNTTNKLWSVANDKSTWYEILYMALPKSHYKKISYIKKKDKESTKKNDKSLIEHLANNYEISQKEVESYLESDIIDKKLINQIRKELISKDADENDTE